jgi:hypothetical protein
MISKLLVEYIFLHHEKDGSGSSLYLLNKDWLLFLSGNLSVCGKTNFKKQWASMGKN